MPASRSTPLFNLFRQRGPRGFEPALRYYDPLKEEQQERLKRYRAKADAKALREADRVLFSSRMQHAWQRRNSERANLLRMLLALGVVLLVLYILAMRFGLLGMWNG